MTVRLTNSASCLGLHYVPDTSVYVSQGRGHIEVIYTSAPRRSLTGSVNAQNTVKWVHHLAVLN